MSSGLLALAWVSSLQRANTSTEASGGDGADAQPARTPNSRNGTIRVMAKSYRDLMARMCAASGWSKPCPGRDPRLARAFSPSGGRGEVFHATPPPPPPGAQTLKTHQRVPQRDGEAFRPVVRVCAFECGSRIPLQRCPLLPQPHRPRNRSNARAVRGHKAAKSQLLRKRPLLQWSKNARAPDMPSQTIGL